MLPSHPTTEVPRTLVARLRAMRREFEASGAIILASNRGPLQFELNESDELETTRGSGGLVTALAGLAEHVPLTWVSCATSHGEREAVKAWGNRFALPGAEGRVALRYVVPSRSAYHRYYNIVSNSLLWFLQHYLWEAASSPSVDGAIYDAWFNGYVPINQAFADAIADEASSQADRLPIVMVQDYHLYLAPAFVRERMRDALLLHFIHIPWPAPRYWLLLPQIMRRDICDSLCASDIVGFQTAIDARNFLFCCEWTLPEAVIDYTNSTVEWRGRKTRVRAYPISIDPGALRELAASPEVKAHLESLAQTKGRQTIVRVDRMEPSKNIIRGFRAYEIMLERHPELWGKVRFLAFLVPSRTNLQHYKNYSQQVRAQIESINKRFGSADWKPIRLFYEDNYPQAIAGLSLSDVLLVNPVMDGMNLVAKEGPTVNTRDGVLILSESAGAFAQLGEFALPVSAADLEATSNALYTALTMAPAERRRRAQQLRKCIAEEDITLWLWWQMQDIKEIQATRTAAASVVPRS